jgi:hypothetical protein
MKNTYACVGGISTATELATVWNERNPHPHRQPEIRKRKPPYHKESRPFLRCYIQLKHTFITVF